MKMHVNRVKPVSAMKKYEYLRANGVIILEKGLPHVLKGTALDDYIDRAVFIEAHPGQEPEYDVPAE